MRDAVNREIRDFAADIWSNGHSHVVGEADEEVTSFVSTAMSSRPVLTRCRNSASGLSVEPLNFANTPCLSREQINQSTLLTTSTVAQSPHICVIDKARIFASILSSKSIDVLEQDDCPF